MVQANSYTGLPGNAALENGLATLAHSTFPAATPAHLARGLEPMRQLKVHPGQACITQCPPCRGSTSRNILTQELLHNVSSEDR